MLLATLLLFACNSDGDSTPTDDTETVAGTATRPIVEAVDSARDSGGATGDTQETPTEPERMCSNGEDDDGDGFIDCDDTDCTNTPDCSDGEICDDGIDNNFDGLIDCMQPSCDFDPYCDSWCADEILRDPLPLRITGSTAGGGNDVNPSTCAYSSAADRAFAFVAPADGTYTFDTFGSSYDTVLYMFDECGGREVACNDDTGGLQSQVRGPIRAGQRVIVVVDGYATNQGNFRLTIRE
jgi:hypothetical protein